MTWRELSNALSFGGHYKSPKKQTVEYTKEENDAALRRLSMGEMSELMRSMSEADQARIHELRRALHFTPSEHGRSVSKDGITLLDSRQAWCEAMIIYFEEKEVSE